MNRLALVAIALSLIMISVHEAQAKEAPTEPGPPAIPQPEPKPQPIPSPVPEPIEDPFPEESDSEKVKRLTRENQDLRAANSKLAADIEVLKSEKLQLQNKVEELTLYIVELHGVIQEQLDEILLLTQQITQTIFANMIAENRA